MRRTDDRNRKTYISPLFITISAIVLLALLSCYAVSRLGSIRADQAFDCYREIYVEYGHRLKADDFFDHVPEGVEFLTDLAGIDTGTLGQYPVKIAYKDNVMDSVVNVEDLTPPTATALYQELYLIDEVPAPEDCVRNIEDLTDVKVYYKNGTPVFEAGGDYKIELCLEDASGNETVIEVPFTVKDDHVPPVISGIHDINVIMGDSVSYRSGIVVKDNYDPNPTLTVDSSKVNLGLVGSYPLVYTACDACGNERTVTVSLNVVTRRTAGITDTEDQETINKAYAMAEEIYNEICKDDTTDVEKAFHIFEWVHDNIAFAHNSSDYTTWAHAAVKAFTMRQGSCYAAWACCKALLDYAKIDNICVTTYPVSWRVHYWCLVYLNGGWYHCDAQRYTWDWKFFDFMETDDEVKRVYNSIHRFDKTLYPETSKESVKKYIDTRNRKISSKFPYKEVNNDG